VPEVPFARSRSGGAEEQESRGLDVMISANVVDYDQVTATYVSGLNTQLRGFRGGARFLEHWVHDPDPVKSIVNMIEAAETDGLPDVTVVIGAGTQAAVDMARLDKLAAELGQVAKEERAGGLALTVCFTRAGPPWPARRGGRAIARRAREARDACARRPRWRACAAPRPTACIRSTATRGADLGAPDPRGVGRGGPGPHASRRPATAGS
jgi:hypothetical protein